MTPEYILQKSLCRPEHCGPYSIESRKAEIENMGYSHAYADGQGYTDPAKGILFANWNYHPSKAVDLLTAYGYECEWSDEWDTCSNCNKALRCSADCYHWQPVYADMEGDRICLECLTHGSETETYLESLEDNPRTALNIAEIDPAAHGYELLQDHFESGFHPGQTDDPKKIFQRLSEEGKTRLLFRIDEVSQFYSVFSVWRKTPEPAPAAAQIASDDDDEGEAQA